MFFLLFQGLALTPDGNIVVADSGNHCFKIYKYLQQRSKGNYGTVSNLEFVVPSRKISQKQENILQHYSGAKTPHFKIFLYSLTVYFVMIENKMLKEFKPKVKKIYQKLKKVFLNITVIFIFKWKGTRRKGQSTMLYK